MPPPKLPINQDCHELWSKRRRRMQREQQQHQAEPFGFGAGISAPDKNEDSSLQGYIKAI